MKTELNPLETAHKVIENFKSLLEAKDNRVKELESRIEKLREALEWTQFFCGQFREKNTDTVDKQHVLFVADEAFDALIEDGVR